MVTMVTGPWYGLSDTIIVLQIALKTWNWVTSNMLYQFSLGNCWAWMFVLNNCSLNENIAFDDLKCSTIIDCSHLIWKWVKEINIFLAFRDMLESWLWFLLQIDWGCHSGIPCFTVLKFATGYLQMSLYPLQTKYYWNHSVDQLVCWSIIVVG